VHGHRERHVCKLRHQSRLCIRSRPALVAQAFRAARHLFRESPLSQAAAGVNRIFSDRKALGEQAYDSVRDVAEIERLSRLSEENRATASGSKGDWASLPAFKRLDGTPQGRLIDELGSFARRHPCAAALVLFRPIILLAFDL
jgi:hypothetical protein